MSAAAPDQRSPDIIDRDETINAAIDGLIDRFIAISMAAQEPDDTAEDHLLSAAASLASRLSAMVSMRLLQLHPADPWPLAAITVAGVFAEEAGDTIHALPSALREKALGILGQRTRHGAAGMRR